MSHRLVLDTNCIIDLEENRSDAQHLSLLVQAWKTGSVELAIVAVSAAENQRSGFANPDYGLFESKLKNVGLREAHELAPIMFWDVFYWDRALWSFPEGEALEAKVSSILFPGIAVEAPENINENSKWRNQMCDVLVAWSCIHHKWQSLATRDENFHKHRLELKAIGLNEILYPAEAAQRYAPELT